MTRDHIPEQLQMPKAGEFRCALCSFVRTFGTDKGALDGAAKHMLEAHRVRLTLPVRSHGGLYGGER